MTRDPCWRQEARPWPEVVKSSWTPETELRPLRKLPARAFFGRTVLHEGLKALLVAVFERLSGDSEVGVFHLGDAVGTGRTHALATLFHAARSGEDLPDNLLDALMEAGMVEAPPCVVAGVDARRVSAQKCASGTAPLPRLLLVDHADAWTVEDIELVSRALTHDGRGAVVFAGLPAEDVSPWQRPISTELLAVVRARLFEPVPKEDRGKLSRRATALTEGGSRTDRQRLIASWPLDPRVIDRAVAFQPGLAAVVAAVAEAIREAGDGPLVTVAPVAKPASKPVTKPVTRPVTKPAPKPGRGPSAKMPRRRSRSTTAPPTVGPQKLLAALRRLVRAEPEGPFERVVLLPSGPDAVPDEPRLTLVALLPLGKQGVDRAVAEVLARGPGGSDRRFRNSVLFVTASEGRATPALEELKRLIGAERALATKGAALGAARLRELRGALETAKKGLVEGLAGCWDTLLVPGPSGTQKVALPEGAGMRARAWKAAIDSGAVREALSPDEVFAALDRRGWAVRDHLSLFDAQLVLASAIGAPRLAGREVLEGALAKALAEGKGFAVASGFSHLNARYTDLRRPTLEDLLEDDDILLVKHEVAARHGM